MRQSVRRAVVSVVVPVALVAVAACGSEEAGSGTTSSISASSTTTAELPTSTELFDQAKATALAAKSVHLSGSVTNDGVPMDIDLAGQLDGSNQTLELGLGAGLKATIFTVGKKYYLLANDEFWTEQGGGDLADALKDKYVLVPAEAAKDFGDLTVKDALTEMFEDEDLQAIGKSGTVAKGRLDGAEVYTLSDAAGAQQGQLFLSADGKATLLKMIGPRDDPGQLTFSDWNEVAPVKAPSASKVVELPR
jgi:hypothetical protein